MHLRHHMELQEADRQVLPSPVLVKAREAVGELDRLLRSGDITLRDIHSRVTTICNIVEGK